MGLEAESRYSHSHWLLSTPSSEITQAHGEVPAMILAL